MQNVLLYVLERETLIGLGLRYFTMLCNDAEYKNMDQDDLPQAIRLGLLIFYNTSPKFHLNFNLVNFKYQLLGPMF